MSPKESCAWRRSTGQTQLDVARRLGVTRGYYALYEQGRAPLGAATLKKLELLVSGRLVQPPKSTTDQPKKIATKRRDSSILMPPPGAPEAAVAIVQASGARRGEFLDLYAKIIKALT